MPLVGNIVLLAERTKSCGDRDAPSLGLSQASVPALWGARGMIKKEKKKNSNMLLQTHLDSWRLFYRNTE